VQGTITCSIVKGQSNFGASVGRGVADATTAPLAQLAHTKTVTLGSAAAVLSSFPEAIVGCLFVWLSF
jgi:hypothetical protein